MQEVLWSSKARAINEQIEAKKKELKAQRILARKKEYVRRCRAEEELRMKIEYEEKQVTMKLLNLTDDNPVSFSANFWFSVWTELSNISFVRLKSRLYRLSSILMLSFSV